MQGYYLKACHVHHRVGGAGMQQHAHHEGIVQVQAWKNLQRMQALAAQE
jgi:hypothetical protein